MVLIPVNGLAMSAFRIGNDWSWEADTRYQNDLLNRLQNGAEVARSLAILLEMLLKWLREVSGGIQKVIASLRAKRRSSDEGEGMRLTAKCPKCGKPGFRMVDRQR